MNDLREEFDLTENTTRVDKHSLRNDNHTSSDLLSFGPEPDSHQSSKLDRPSSGLESTVVSSQLKLSQPAKVLDLDNLQDLWPLESSRASGLNNQGSEQGINPHLHTLQNDYSSTTTVEEDFGDFQESQVESTAGKADRDQIVNSHQTGIQPESNLYSTPTIKTGDAGSYVSTPASLGHAGSLLAAPQSLEPDEEDDFGDFMDSSETGTVIYTKDRDTQYMTIPSIEQLLEALQATILFVPEAFISELAASPYPLRQSVLKHKSTQSWLQAVLEGSKVAQRVISGRNRRIKEEKARDHARIACIRIGSHWDTLLPRLVSLSSGTISARSLDLEPLEPVQEEVCEICFTTAKEGNDMLVEKDGRTGHRSCTAFLAANDT